MSIENNEPVMGYEELTNEDYIMGVGLGEHSREIICPECDEVVEVDTSANHIYKCTCGIMVQVPKWICSK